MSIQACADLVHRGDPDRFAAIMAAPVAARERLFPIFAFNLEVARAPWVTAEAMIAEMRLQWWRDALEEIANGADVRRHEVTTPLYAAIDAETATMLDALVTARQWDIYADPFEDQAAFDRYIDATSGHLLWAAARATGTTTGEQAVRDAAYGIGVANWLLAIPGLVERGKIPLLDGTPDGVKTLATTALARLKSAQKQAPKSAAPVLRTGWMAEPTLRRAIQTPALVADGQLARPDGIKRASLLWKSLRGTW